ncbi:apolipoprotein N-acyltransferase [Psittacicella hinzii]|uniref:Apolipoprotein N-acyltransferase n=1 Tax=Psittacicella hinzii TaxID=2028575 RepID=A0A3A1YUV9_9GAMM|nr:apolipoprotein N-acyltransferase [Psittacicella hinzii]RIY39857.1 apolipoprotein N-acyltransferase [Psittacicella hinzii]
MIINNWSLRFPLLFLAAFTGYFMYLGFAPYYSKSAFYICLFFYIFFLQTKANDKRGSYLLPYAWDVAFSFGTLYWLTNAITYYGDFPPWASILALFGLSLVLGIRSIILAAIWNGRDRNFALLPLAFSGITYLWYNLITNFNWLNFGYANANTLSQTLAPLGGVYLVQFFEFSAVTFVYVLVRKLIVARQPNSGMSLRRQTIDRQLRINFRTDVIVLALLTGGFAAAHFYPMQFTKPEGKPITVALVQPNIESRAKWDPQQIPAQVDTYKYLIQRGQQATTEPQLWILPESAVMQIFTGNPQGQQEQILSHFYILVASSNADMLVGSLTASNEQGQTRYYNSALMLSQVGLIKRAVTANNQILHTPELDILVQKYDKTTLVPFGEYLPLGGLLSHLPIPFFKELYAAQFTAGNRNQANMRTQYSLAHTLVCYDTLFADLVLRNVNDNTNVLLNITNDVWFGHVQGPDQHLNIARFRSLESQRYSLRDTNNGITAIINPQGKITALAPRDSEEVLVGQYLNYVGTTPYQAYYRWLNFAYAFTFIALYALIRGVVSLFTRNNRYV